MTSTSNKLFAWGVLTSSVAVGVMGLVNYFSRRTLALGLQGEDFAFFYGCFALVALFGSCLDFGSGSALAILLPKYQIRGKQAAMRAYCANAFGLRLLAACIVTCVLMALAQVFSTYVYHYPSGMAVFYWTLSLLPFFVVFGFFIDICTALQEFAFRSWLFILQTSLALIGILILLPLYGTKAAPWAFLASYAAAIMVGAVLLVRKYPFFRPLPVVSAPLLRRLWRLSRWFFLVSLGTALLSNLDSLMLAAFSSLHNLALYNTALPVMNIFQVLLVVPGIFMPLAAKLWQHGDKAELARLYSDVQAFLLVMCGACIVLAAVSGEWLLGFLFKQEFAAAAPALALLTSGIFFACMAQMNCSLLGTIDSPGKIAAAVCAGAVVGVVGSFVGAVYFGCAGVAAARALGMAVMFAVSQYYVSRLSALKFSWKYGIQAAAATGIMGALTAIDWLHGMLVVRSVLCLLFYFILIIPLLPPIWKLTTNLIHFRNAGQV
jgi:O-antigen/teichoic acid export membrane protein